MSMTELAPNPTTSEVSASQTYSEAWWQRWRQENALARSRYNQTGSNRDKRALQRHQVRVIVGLVYYVVDEGFAAVREKFRRTP